MPVQNSTDYLAEHIRAFEGGRAHLTLINRISRVVESIDIPFGRAVVAGSTDNYCDLPSIGGQRFLGITEYTSGGQNNSSGNILYEVASEANIVNFGYIYVLPEVAVAAGDQVFFRHTFTGLEESGTFRNDSDDGDCDLITGAVFELDSAAGEFNIINLNVTPGARQLYTVFTAVGDIPSGTGTAIIDSTAGAFALGLDNGYEGETLDIVMSVDGGDVIVTPTNFFNGTNITFNDAGDTVTLKFISNNWFQTAINGAVVA
jgi:hypothetical protein